MKKRKRKITNYDRGITTAGALFQAAVVQCFRHPETAATVSIDGGRAIFPSTTFVLHFPQDALCSVSCSLAFPTAAKTPAWEAKQEITWL